MPVSIGAASWIGPRAIVRAAAIGAGAIVGADAVVVRGAALVQGLPPPNPRLGSRAWALRQGERAVLGSFCEVKEGAVVAPGTNVPPFAVVAGAPGETAPRLGLRRPASLLYPSLSAQLKSWT